MSAANEKAANATDADGPTTENGAIKSYPIPEGAVKELVGDPNRAQFASATFDAEAILVQFCDGRRFEFPAAGLRAWAERQR